MKSIRHTFIYLLILLMASLYTFSQDSSSLTNTRISHNAIFSGGQSAWENYLRKNVDTTIPIRNKAKKGTYNVIVKFIIAKDGLPVDVRAETCYGYGMEEEVVRAIKKSPRWGWVSEVENSKNVNLSCTQSFIFLVPKKKASANKRI